MAISDKLNYLIETKSKFKDRLNSLGAEIIESTTFRNYLNWLDTFYGDVSDKTDLAKNGVVGRTNQNIAILPNEYTQVDYIESSGTQYIDTGFIPNQNTRTIIDFMPTYSSGSLFIFGSRLGYNNNAYDLYTYSNKFRDDYATTNYGGASSEPFPKTANKRYLFDKDKNHSSMYEDNVQFYDHTFTKKTINSGFNMFLFGLNDNGSVMSSNIAKMKLYSCKIYDNAILVRDFIPCYRNSDNEVGLYDIVNDVFYTNQGTDVFTYGSVVSIPNPDYPQEINNLSGDVEYKVRGKNKLPFPYTETSHTNNGITYTINDDGTVLVNGTATAQSNTKLYGNYQEADNKEPIGKYLYGGTNEVRIRALNHTGDSYTVLATDTGNGAEINTSVYKKYYIEISVLQGVTVNNVLIKPMVLDSLDNLKYEPYISESFPLSLKSRNLFDKDNANVLDGMFINAIAGNIGSNANTTSIYIPINPNTTYCVSKTRGNRFAIGYSSTTPAVNVSLTNIVDDRTKTSLTSASASNSKYLVIYISLSDTETLQEILDSIMINEGSTVTSYEPYYDIELCKIGDYQDKIAKSSGKNICPTNINDWQSGQYNATTGVKEPHASRICVKDLIPITPNTSYYLNNFDSNDSFIFREYNSSKEFINNIGPLADGNVITTSNNGAYISITLYSSTNQTRNYETYKTMFENGTIKPLVCLNSELDKSYEPYGKVWYLHKDIGKVVLDGSESGGRILDNNQRIAYNSVANPKLADVFIDTPDSVSNLTPSLSTHFSPTMQGRITTTNNSFGFSQWGGQKYIYISAIYDNIEDFKTWLSTHNTVVYYVLATPITTKITQENYPTLYSQLLAIQEFLTKYKINKEFLLDYSSPEIEY